MVFDRILLSTHAARRMYERGVYPADVQRVLATGTVIETYPDDLPLPSYLVLGWVDSEREQRAPVHVVAADDDEHATTHVITVYKPDLERWEPDYRTRRKP